MRILGIDPGIATTGFAIIEKRLELFNSLEYGVIRTPADMPIGERLLNINNKLTDIIDKYKPEEASVEILFFSKNVKTAITVAHARGVILFSLEKMGLKFFEYTPKVIKQAVTGNGNADKIQVQNMVKLIFGFKQIPKPDDAADALAVAMCHAQNYQMQRKINKIIN